MAVISEKSNFRPRRRWIAHMAWLMVSVAALCGGIYLGIRWGTAALGSMDMGNHRFQALQAANVTVTALERDDPAQIRSAAAFVLSESIFHLAGTPRYSDCVPAERDVLKRSLAWLDANRPATYDALRDIRGMAAQFCDKPAEPVNFP
jgi:hypothetical protein